MGETAVLAPEKGREGRYVQRKGLGKACGMTVGLFRWGNGGSRAGKEPKEADGKAGPSGEMAKERLTE